MPSKIASKQNLSSKQVLKTLLLLLEDNYTMSELVEKLNEREDQPVFNNSVVSKYICTCRYAGFSIPKFNNKYYVTSVPFGMDLTPGERNLIEELQRVAMLSFNGKTLKKINEVIENISKYSNKRILKVQEETYKTTLDLFKQAIKEKRHVALMYRSKVIKHCHPIKVGDKNGLILLHVEYRGKIRSVKLKNIKALVLQDSRFTNEEDSRLNVTYKIYNPLAKRYEIKDNETLIEHRDDYSVILYSGYESEEDFYSRLLRYDSLCEIVTAGPRQKMKEIVDKMLSNYGE